MTFTNLRASRWERQNANSIIWLLPLCSYHLPHVHMYALLTEKMCALFISTPIFFFCKSSVYPWLFLFSFPMRENWPKNKWGLAYKSTTNVPYFQHSFIRMYSWVVKIYEWWRKGKVGRKSFVKTSNLNRSHKFLMDVMSFFLTYYGSLFFLVPPTGEIRLMLMFLDICRIFLK